MIQVWNSIEKNQSWPSLSSDWVHLRDITGQQLWSHTTWLGALSITSSIRLEILGVNIQCWSLSKRKTEISQNVLVSIRKFTKKRKNALIKPVVYNLWNVSNGMVCTISFSNQNFQTFCVNGKRSWCPLTDLTVACTNQWTLLRTVPTNKRYFFPGVWLCRKCRS